MIDKLVGYIILLYIAAALVLIGVLTILFLIL